MLILVKSEDKHLNLNHSFYLILQTNLKQLNKDAPTTENVMPNEEFSDADLKHVRQHSKKNRSKTQNITIENGGITLSINDKHYLISRFHQALLKSFLDDLVPRRYKWLVRSFLTALVLALAIGIIYIVIFTMKCSDCKEEL